jgi:hypothetical protein
MSLSFNYAVYRFFAVSLITHTIGLISASYNNILIFDFYLLHQFTVCVFSYFVLLLTVLGFELRALGLVVATLPLQVCPSPVFFLIILGPMCVI